MRELSSHGKHPQMHFNCVLEKGLEHICLLSPIFKQAL